MKNLMVPHRRTILKVTSQLFFCAVMIFLMEFNQVGQFLLLKKYTFFISLGQVQGKIRFKPPKKEVWGVSCYAKSKKAKMDVEYQCKPNNYCYQNDIFLDIILDRYDILPDYVIFSDSHEKSWHNRFRFGYALRHTRFVGDFGPIYGNMYDGANDKNKVDNYDYQALYNYVFQEGMPPFNKTVSSHPCCCIFYVSKKAILSNSKEFYRGIRDRLRNWSVSTKRATPRSEGPSYYCGRLMEYNWHVIFTYNIKKLVKYLIRNDLFFSIFNIFTVKSGTTIGSNIVMVEQPEKGLLIGTLVYLGIALAAVLILTIVFRKGQVCYANTFALILIAMAYIMWMCTYMCQMYPLVFPEKTI